jgi:hypothetical protein
MSTPNTTPISDLRAHWAEVCKLLRAARAWLPLVRESVQTSAVPPGELVETPDDFEEFLEHNELELAWDTLASLADRYSAPSECWRLLAHSAGLMGLLAKQGKAASRMNLQIPAEQALAIARRDGEAAYRDLSFFRVTLTLEPDGWHVDYELKDPLVSGGGPHYVIDPTSGAIVEKRYEQ